MYFKSTLSLVLALAATTAVSLSSLQGRAEARIARRVSGANKLRSEGGEEVNSTDWAGAVINASPGTFTSIAASFTLPTPYVPEGADPSGNYSAVIVVGIDGNTCPTATLQAGVVVSLEDGQPSYTALAQFSSPLNSATFPDISLSAGDLIAVGVTAVNATSGMAVIINQSTGESGYVSLTSPDTPLCMMDGEWIVRFGDEPLPNFGTVVFTYPVAETPSGPVDASHANITDIVQGDTFLAYASISPSSVSVTFA
ncbi:uncharacterized protein PHACADRAFT_193949 [Phanerochaete carnosa HHB-10118-sp]|uniref:Uncharacterized protein n=1 Tax=Phanerochaete carnosa (strain HHB-10118-sp) TaxID=650164 RepID=K5X0R2_PHACS|nr:uncharacterized protein PHACADRAFT_193949 [Phanerochaete carnosa HHB-10118-sp]EKM56332.1 hypothetical protein PHACADRAFT_193949 [Phanerochaete carnosa HHB-10118-sp]